jgi:hypothetical protein
MVFVITWQQGASLSTWCLIFRLWKGWMAWTIIQLGMLNSTGNLALDESLLSLPPINSQTCIVMEWTAKKPRIEEDVHLVLGEEVIAKMYQWMMAMGVQAASLVSLMALIQIPNSNSMSVTSFGPIQAPPQRRDSPHRTGSPCRRNTSGGRLQTAPSGRLTSQRSHAQLDQTGHCGRRNSPRPKRVSEESTMNLGGTARPESDWTLQFPPRSSNLHAFISQPVDLSSAFHGSNAKPHLSLVHNIFQVTTRHWDLAITNSFPSSCEYQ